ncbi:MAG: hypothetical protein GY934_21995 [Gammaproteobacteria bacterium]|nr:hypothetical protein [Gammaproteobacteria bacterium]
MEHTVEPAWLMLSTLSGYSTPKGGLLKWKAAPKGAMLPVPVNYEINDEVRTDE